MFHLEIRNLVHEYKNSSEYSRPKIREHIANLVQEHKDEYERLVSQGVLEDPIIEVIEKCREEKKQPDEDIEYVKKLFSNWVANYRSNDNEPNQECQQIIVNLITTYAPNRFEVLEKLLKMSDSQEFEKFKIMLMNFLQTYYAEKIMEYYESDSFKEKGFFEKRKKRNQLLSLTDEIGEYKFNSKKINEVLS